jgi:PST family polysaccharide transporter
MLADKKYKIKQTIENYSKVIENYFFMTSLQIINSAFGILIYPYAIRTLGSESYGLYVFALAISSYFVSFINFGFNMPGLKIISQNKDSKNIKSTVVSEILSAKIYLSIFSTVIFIVLLFMIPFLREHKLILSLSYLLIINEIVFPIWYFQGVQKMKIVTYIQLSCRLFSLPFIFIFIKSPADCWIFTLISVSTLIVSGVGLLWYLIRFEKLKIRITSFSKTYYYFREAMPFFWSSTVGTIKQESVTIIIGSFLGMRDVALYDLANKLIIIPRMLTTSINAALFPKVIEDIKRETIRKIIHYEILIGFAVAGFITIFGYWLILLLGGSDMIDAYPLAIILSFTVLVWLVVGSYISFIFVPQNKYYYVTWNQIVALLAFAICCIPSVYIFHSVWSIVLSLTLSGFCEIAYCNIIIKKNKLL